MTRSEMLYILSNSVYKNVVGDSHDFDTVLHDLEKAGMLPPRKPNGCCFEMISEDYEWEPEDVASEEGSNE